MSGPSNEQRGRGRTMIVDRDPARDVELAHDRVRNAEQRYGRPPRQRPPTPGARLRTFVRRWGWRAYALPILAVLTVAALMTTSTSPGSSPSSNAAGPATSTGRSQAAAPPTASAQVPLKSDNAGALSGGLLAAAALPAGAPYTKQGDGTFRTLPGTTPKVGEGQLYRYSIDVENGVTGVDLNQFQTMVDTTLADPRSWSGHGVQLQRVDKGATEFRVTLTSTMTTRKYCGFEIPVETSCYQSAGPKGLDENRVFFNVARWMRGAPAYLGDLNAYRLYMINHEDGHALGHRHAHQCLPGGLAPAMMQQTFGLRATRDGKQLCSANPWPYPVGVKGAPGAEQTDTEANNEYGRGD